MPLFDHDPYAMLTRIFDPAEPITLLDVGANVGDTGRRLLAEFPRATVHAFEPTPDVYEVLAARGRDTAGLRPQRLAVGAANGAVEFHVTKNRWCSSVLPPGERGRAYYGAWYERERTIEVEMVRLDDWARDAGVERIDAMKIDVQGLELDVLRGAEDLLRRSVQAIISEAQLVPDYDGACTFSDIDLFLRDRGYLIHQVHDVFVRGPELQSSYLDGLWLREDVLERLRAHPAPVRGSAATNALTACARDGLDPVALYGAGRHTQGLAATLMDPPVAIDCIVDDDPARRGGRLWGYPIVSREQAADRGVRAVVLSSDSMEDALWTRSAYFRERGIAVKRLYTVEAPECSIP